MLICSCALGLAVAAGPLSVQEGEPGAVVAGVQGLESTQPLEPADGVAREEPLRPRRFAIAFNAPYGGWIPDRDQSGSGGRVGFEVPFVYGVEIGGVYEIWIGARGSGEYVFGDFQVDGSEQKASGAGLRAGPVIGMALGVRRIHALIELTAAYEYWFIDHAGDSLNRGGFVLIPGFGIRLRL